jgi:predicted dehydrogenase
LCDGHQAGVELSAPQKLRAAVIGVGAMGRHHARVYTDIDETMLVGVADAEAETAEAVGRRYNVPWFTDHRELLVETRPDLVSLAVPTKLHLRVGLDVLAAGVHLLVEKPIAATLEEGRLLMVAAGDSGRVLTVGHVERFNPAVRELRRRLDVGELGRVFSVQARRMGPFPARIRDVGVVVDLATHDLDVMRWLVGAPVTRVYAETARRIHTEHEDMLSGLLRFESGEVGVLLVNWLTPTKIRELALTGERGMFVVDYLHQDLYFYENVGADSYWEDYGVLQNVEEGAMTRMRIDHQEPLVLELAAFARAVREGLAPEVSAEDGLRALELARALVASGREGEVVQMKQEPAT